MLRGYYDGSGTHGNSEVLTLAGMVASESVWDRFEVQWGAILLKYEITGFHTKYAIAYRGQFARENNWDERKIERLIWDLWKVIGRFRAVKDSPDSNLTATSCTIIMNDYRQAKLDNPALREPAAICVKFCVTRMPVDLDSIHASPEIALIFDRSEPFLHTIHRNWQDFKNDPDAGWPRQMKHIVTKDREIVSMGNSNIYPLQAADLLAWTMNRNHRASVNGPSWALVPSLAAEHHSKTYDYTSLMREFPNG